MLLRTSWGADVLVAGDLDRTSADHFADEAARGCDPSQEARFDLRDVRYVDSGGLRALIDLSRRHRAAGGRVRYLTNGNHVGQLLDLVGLREEHHDLSSVLDAPDRGEPGG